MILNDININNFMIFQGQHNFKLTSGINVITGKNESGKSVLTVDAFKYVFFKRIRYKKIEHVINNEIDSKDHGFVEIYTNIQNTNLIFKRYLLHPTYKNNLAIGILDENMNPIKDGKSIAIISDLDNLVNLKGTSIQSFLKTINIDLDFFELVSVYNPTKNILSDKSKILELLSVNFNNVISLFNSIYSSFESDIKGISNEINNLEYKLNNLVKSMVDNEEIELIMSNNVEISESVEKLRNEREKRNETLSKGNTLIGEQNAIINESVQTLKKLNHFHSTGICYACERPFDGDMEKIEKQINEKNEIINLAKQRSSQLTTAINKLRDRLSFIDREIREKLETLKQNEKSLVNKNTEVDTLRNLVSSRRQVLDEFEEKFLSFKKIYNNIFSQESINSYTTSKIQLFESLYNDIYLRIVEDSNNVKLNLNKYEEPEFDDFLYSGLSTSKKRLVYLILMLSLHVFCDLKIDFLVLDEFFDVFDFNRMIKTLESIFNEKEFSNLQFIITSNNDNLVDLIKKQNTAINLINLIDSK